jgi:hypothetical protein
MGATSGEGSILPPGNWRLVLDDEFNGNSIDQSIWTGIAPDGGGIAGQGCAVNSLAISVGGGFLTLRGRSEFTAPIQTIIRLASVLRHVRAVR